MDIIYHPSLLYSTSQKLRIFQLNVNEHQESSNCKIRHWATGLSLLKVILEKILSISMVSA